jgi:hypothetical protein
MRDEFIHIGVGKNKSSTLPYYLAVQSSCLNGLHHFILRRPIASHQIGDRREPSHYLVAAGDLPHALASQAELLANGLKAQTTCTQLDYLLSPFAPSLRVHGS